MFSQIRDHWALNDSYRAPGPIQFEEGKDRVNFLVKAPTIGDLSKEVAKEGTCYSPKVLANQSPLAMDRMNTPVVLPQLLQNGLD